MCLIAVLLHIIVFQPYLIYPNPNKHTNHSFFFISMFNKLCLWPFILITLHFHCSSLGVQSAAVNVICELARRNPKNYLSLAPLFFKLMTSSTNNWVLIKIIKLVSQQDTVFLEWCRNITRGLILQQHNIYCSSPSRGFVWHPQCCTNHREINPS